MKRILTNSELSCFTRCRLQHKFQYTEGLRPVVPSTALTLGSAVHWALEQYYTPGVSIDDTGLIMVADGYLTVEKHKIEAHSGTVDEEQWLLALATSEAMLRGYIPFALVNDRFTVRCVEQQFSVPILTDNGRKSTRFMYAGKADGVVELDGELWLLEHKTKAKFDEEELLRDEQTLRYLWALQQVYGREFRGVIYNVLKKPSIRQKKAESFGEFLLRLTQDYQKRPEFYYIRKNIYHSQKDISIAGERMYKIALEMTSPAIYRQAGMHCKWCSYSGLCLDDNDMMREGFRTATTKHEELNF